jgi:hypothetical protein
MPDGNVDYEAVLADLLARKAQLEMMIAGVEAFLGSAASGVVAVSASNGSVMSLDRIPSHAFLKLSIGDATKKLLDMVKSKLTLPQIMQALEKGGLPPAKYSTVYAVLRRRESQIGDILRMGEEWGLTEWYPNNPNLRKRTEKPTKGKSKPKKKASAKKRSEATPAAGPARVATLFEPTSTSIDPVTPAMTMLDASEQVLLKSDGPLHAKDLAERLKEYGKNTTASSLSGSLVQDTKKRFKNIGGNTWDLVNRPEK